MKLYGIVAPAGEGTILEVHLDLQNVTPQFADWLQSIGFDPDPFSIFHPAGYVHHMTGRDRVPPATLPEVRAFVADIITQARSQKVALYAEIELARETTYFDPSKSTKIAGVLDRLTFLTTGTFGKAGADVHVEFANGTVPDEVRKYLLAKNFYWVSTPDNDHFSAEEIATLQTRTYQAAKRVYQLLVAEPLPACTGIHLEQKIAMVATHVGLPMPEVISVY
jgi:hypothetical protein